MRVPGAFNLGCEITNVRSIAHIRASCFKCQHSCFVRWEQNPTTAPCSKAGLQERADMNQRACDTCIFLPFTTSSDFSIMNPQVRNLEAKAKMSPWFWNSALRLMDFRIWVFWFLDCMTHWVFKEPPLMMAPFTWIIKFPPGLRTTVSTFGRLRNQWLCTMWATLFHCEALLHLLLVLMGPDRDAMRPKAEHRKELRGPGQGCHTRAGQHEAEGRHSWRHNDSLILFSPSSAQPLLL